MSRVDAEKDNVLYKVFLRATPAGKADPLLATDGAFEGGVSWLRDNAVGAVHIIAEILKVGSY